MRRISWCAFSIILCAVNFQQQRFQFESLVYRASCRIGDIILMNSTTFSEDIERIVHKVWKSFQKHTGAAGTLIWWTTAFAITRTSKKLYLVSGVQKFFDSRRVLIFWRQKLTRRDKTKEVSNFMRQLRYLCIGNLCIGNLQGTNLLKPDCMRVSERHLKTLCPKDMWTSQPCGACEQ